MQPNLEKNEAYECTVTLKLNAAYEKRVLQTSNQMLEPDITLDAYASTIREPVIYEEITALASAAI